MAEFDFKVHVEIQPPDPSIDIMGPNAYGWIESDDVEEEGLDLICFYDTKSSLDSPSFIWRDEQSNQVEPPDFNEIVEATIKRQLKDLNDMLENMAG